ncbi:uncharacterized protein At2g23090 isoform X1 [Ziziphus jujuba]|uniref:Uncharacterized protein At2g23090 isoform X1 n=3 Tax=Ziziphus jujuba TaxID=326968 RepID=A0A6P3ZUE5_ZIZJJ|nr:uncharacterized protein At2g23090-like isoform X1 [Ziziphus jujuba var. spinosa]XP_015900560.1 uncharacterized protein At2g23090 isoform X1 [Ziziphus jujuba]KAH7523713.1 hypothetical protein FEM48_Zijuj06G0040900 [Ziziphus jujuba var. spinosa]
MVHFCSHTFLTSTVPNGDLYICRSSLTSISWPILKSLLSSSTRSSCSDRILRRRRRRRRRKEEEMGGGNGQKSKMARERNLEKQKQNRGSQLESNKKAMTIQCKVCMQTFICTTTEVKCREHAEAKHPKSDVYACFPHLKK